MRKILLLLLSAFLIFSCPGPESEQEGLPDLSGNITITPNGGSIGVTLEANYTGDEDISYQWNEGGEALNGSTAKTYKATAVGTYTVTVSAEGYKSKTSEAVAVTGDAPVTSAMDFVMAMKIGWNLGNSLDAHNNMSPGETAWGNPIVTQALMNGVAARGFGAGRIPVTWGNKIGPAPDYTIDAAWMARVAEVAGYVENAGMKAIINIHHDGADSSHWLSVKTTDLEGPTKEAMDAKFTAVWRQIATHFKDHGNFLLFEAFNELHDGTWGDGNAAQRSRINELDQIFVDTVRDVGGKNAERFLVIPGWVTRPSVTASSLILPTDTVEDRLIVTIHFYEPYNFAGSGSQHKWVDTTTVQNNFNPIRNKYTSRGVPVIVGEYGAVNQSGDGFLYRKYYMEYVTKHAHDCKFVPFYWDNAGFGVGSEKFGLLRRSDGSAYDESAQQILDVMMKAVNQDYLISTITPPSP